MLGLLLGVVGFAALFRSLGTLGLFGLVLPVVLTSCMRMGCLLVTLTSLLLSATWWLMSLVSVWSSVWLLPLFLSKSFPGWLLWGLPRVLLLCFLSRSVPVSTIFSSILSAVAFLCLGVAFGIVFMTDDSTPSALRFAILWCVMGFVTGLIAIIADGTNE
jgi:hypothetical protein